MKVELDRIDLLNLVYSIEPNYAQQQTEEMLVLGRYSKSFSRWIWDKEKIDSMSDKELFTLYQNCKNK